MPQISQFPIKCPMAKVSEPGICLLVALILSSVTVRCVIDRLAGIVELLDTIKVVESDSQTCQQASQSVTSRWVSDQMG
jgi:hypothetical protein